MRKLIISIMLSIMLISIGSLAIAQEEKPYAGETLNVQFMAVGNVMDFENLIPEFEEMTGAKVNLNLGSERAYTQKAAMDLSAKKGSVGVYWYPWGTFHDWADKGWFEPLGAYIERDDWVTEDMVDMDAFPDAALEGLHYQGHQYGFPTLNDNIIMIYREDIFNKVGVEPPDTWWETMEVCEKIEASDEVDISCIGMRGSKDRGGADFNFPAVLKAQCGSIVKDYPEDMRPNLLDSDTIEAAKYYDTLLNEYGFEGAATAHHLDLVTAYQQGEAAMIMGSNVASHLFVDPEKSVAAGKTGFATPPMGPCGAFTPTAIHGISIPSNYPNKDLAFEFIQWATSPEVQWKNVIEHGVTNVTIPELRTREKFHEQFEDFDSEQWVEVVNKTEKYWSDPYYRPMNPEWSKVGDAFGIAMSRILTGQMSVEESFKRANEEIYEIYEEAGYYD